MENLLVESEESNFVKHSTQLDEIYDDQEMNFSTTDMVESDEDDGRNSETFNSRKSKWYIEKDGSLIHIKRALKLLIPREFISKERSCRHWVADSLHTSLVPIDSSHDVIQFRDVAIRDGNGYFILHILSIISEDGRVGQHKFQTQAHDQRHNIQRRRKQQVWICEYCFCLPMDTSQPSCYGSRARERQ